MKINSIKNYIFAGILSTTMTACQKASFRPMPAKYINTALQTKVDSFALKTQEILKDTTYVRYGYDTLELSKDFIKNPTKFLKSINKKATANTKKVKYGEHTEIVDKYVGDGLDFMHNRTVSDYCPEYINNRAVVNSTQIQTTDSVKTYIPVEYYGTLNPKLKTVEQ